MSLALTIATRVVIFTIIGVPSTTLNGIECLTIALALVGVHRVGVVVVGLDEGESWTP